MNGAICRKIGFGSFAILVLLIGGAAQFGLQLLYNSTSDSTLQIVLLISNSFIILMFNFIIMITLIVTTKKQRNQTLTQYQNTLMVKLAVFQFFNAGIFVIGAQIGAKSENFKIDEGICSQVTIVMITNCLIPNISLIILNYTQMVNNIFRFLQSKQIMIVTQEELNVMHLGPEIQFSSKYAFILKIVWLTGFYSSLVPVVVVFAILGLALNYLFEKILFAKAYSVPNTVSSMVYENALELTEYLLITYAMGQLIIYFYFYSYSIESMPLIWLISIFVCLFLGLINLVLPMDSLNQVLFNIPDTAKSMVKYSSIEQDFDVTYEMVNPAYKTIRKRKNKKDILGLGGVLQEEKSKQIAYEMTNLFGMNLQNQNKNNQPLLNKPNPQQGILSFVANKQGEQNQQKHKKQNIQNIMNNSKHFNKFNNTQQEITFNNNQLLNISAIKISPNQQAQNDKKGDKITPLNIDNIKKSNKHNKNDPKSKTPITPHMNQLQNMINNSNQILPKHMKKPKPNHELANNQQKNAEQTKKQVVPNNLQIPLKPNLMDIPLKRFQQQTKQDQNATSNAYHHQHSQYPKFDTVQFVDPQKQKMSRYDPQAINSAQHQKQQQLEPAVKPNYIHKQELSKLLGTPFSSFLRKMSVQSFTEKDQTHRRQP